MTLFFEYDNLFVRKIDFTKKKLFYFVEMYYMIKIRYAEIYYIIGLL